MKGNQQKIIINLDNIFLLIFLLFECFGLGAASAAAAAAIGFFFGSFSDGFRCFGFNSLLLLLFLLLVFGT